jgi:hypothetical protein
MPHARLIRFAGIALVLALAFALNPSADKQRAAIREAVAGALGIGALAAFTTTYDSWGVCSYATMQDRTVSIGALGVVHVRELLPNR